MSDHNIYSSPEAFGLKLVCEWDYSDGNYCFDYRCVWKDEKGNLFTARDAGCSCPSPFEYLTLETLDRYIEESIINEAKTETSSQFYRGDSISDIMSKIRKIKDT